MNYNVNACSKMYICVYKCLEEKNYRKKNEARASCSRQVRSCGLSFENESVPLSDLPALRDLQLKSSPIYEK